MAVGGQPVHALLIAGPDMRRRSFVVGLGVAAAWHHRAFAQQTRTIPRLGMLLSNSPQIDPITPLIQERLPKAAGYTDGETLSIEYRYAEAKRDRLPRLAAEVGSAQPERYLRIRRRCGSLRQTSNSINSNPW